MTQASLQRGGWRYLAGIYPVKSGERNAMQSENNAETALLICGLCCLAWLAVGVYCLIQWP